MSGFPAVKELGTGYRAGLRTADRFGISVPCGFTPEGLPVGVQIVGRYRDDFGVLQLAYAFQQATGFFKGAPAVAV